MSVGSQTSASAIPARVVSQAPGRIRLKVARGYRQPHKMAKITKALKEHLEIYRVRSNAPSGSITIHYAKEHSSHERILKLLRDLDVVFGALTEGKSEAATNLTNTLVDLNQQVRRATDNVLDLRFLIPLGLGALAVRQLLTQGLKFDLIPWYVLAWYAFDSFIKLHDTSLDSE